MSKRDPKLLLDDILEAIEKIKKYTNGLSFETFIDDSIFAFNANLQCNWWVISFD